MDNIITGHGNSKHVPPQTRFEDVREDNVALEPVADDKIAEIMDYAALSQ